MKRIALFVLTNLAIILMLSVVTSVLGVNRFLTAQGLNVGMLLAFAAVVGFGGAFFSLLISKFVAKFSTGARTIEQPANAMESWLLDTVRHHAQKAGLAMPEVAIYEGEPNAFATGAFRNSALVAVSTGLLQTMSKEEVEAVLGHEVTHVANGDMVTMTLLQGVMNTFVVFLSNVLAYVIDRMILRNEDEGPGIGYFAANLVLQIVFGLLASIVVMWFSRRREFRADAGSAQILGSARPMISALQRLGGLEPGELPREISAFGIAGGGGGLGLLFASHPPIEERIAALRALGN
ncbi:MAG TPA: protease HtpX [Burkholderiaceae bacterium]|jgi:heat shock protein HtpX|nr:protease HtpX [Burkholderiaceae bacterium]